MSIVELVLLGVAGLAAVMIAITLLRDGEKPRRKRSEGSISERRTDVEFNPWPRNPLPPRPLRETAPQVPLERELAPSPPEYSQRDHAVPHTPPDTGDLHLGAEETTARFGPTGADAGIPPALNPSVAELPRVAQTVVVSDAFVRELYGRWCFSGTRPQATANFEVVPLRYLRSEAPREYGGPQQHVLGDARQVAEFVRFADPTADVALVLPDPDAHFTPVVNYLFPSLTRADYESPSALSALLPIRIRKRGTEEWESA